MKRNKERNRGRLDSIIKTTKKALKIGSILTEKEIKRKSIEEK